MIGGWSEGAVVRQYHCQGSPVVARGMDVGWVYGLQPPNNWRLEPQKKYGFQVRNLLFQQPPLSGAMLVFGGV